MVPDGEHLADVDEAELGDDPFAQSGDAGGGVDTGSEPWLKSDRDYTYAEVRPPILILIFVANYVILSAPSPILRLPPRL